MEHDPLFDPRMYDHYERPPADPWLLYVSDLGERDARTGRPPRDTFRDRPLESFSYHFGRNLDREEYQRVDIADCLARIRDSGDERCAQGLVDLLWRDYLDEPPDIPDLDRFLGHLQQLMRKHDIRDKTTSYPLACLLYKYDFPSDAKFWFQRAGAAGHIDALVFLGEMWKSEGNERQAARWYLAAIKAGGHPRAVGGLGAILVRGKQWDRAEKLYRQAIAHGHEYAQRMLDDLLLRRRDPEAYELANLATPDPDAEILALQQMHRSAEDRFLRRAQDGDPEAAYQLGLVLLKCGGSLGDPDPLRAMGWFKGAMEAGHPRAEYAYGVALYQSGLLPESEPYLRRGVAMNDSASARCLGEWLHSCYLYAEAVYPLQMAAEAGESAAVGYLADCLTRLGRTEQAEHWRRISTADT
ncbi:tetratricopeptide repeat protein [Nocardia sp. BMG51109]|uniref:tetratricopeptide repeat protein n=1 Tax=Nocardia sp. BMG51109 TaxID=1056816 RepID=UPI000464432D|nr:tetratricopeptide repeat protein [Nocardia sp. BMG51109]